MSNQRITASLTGKLTVAEFNETHQLAFGRAPEFGVPSKDGPDHRPVVSVALTIDDFALAIIGKGSNQRVARQDAVDQAVSMYDRLPHELRRAIDRKREGI